MEKLSQKIGFIGAGNMARAIAGGIVRGGLVDAQQVCASDVSADQLALFEQACGGKRAESNSDVVRKSNVIIVATKPFQVAQVCDEIAADVRPGQLFVSICAGIKTKLFEDKLGPATHAVRVMPNTPALVGAGAAAIAAGCCATSEDLQIVRRIFESVGEAIIAEEQQLDLVTGLSGSGPAYFFRFMEVLIDAAVERGMRQEDAKVLVLQTALGSARMALESGKELHELRAAVTTKGGTTEAGLRALEEGDFSELISECVGAATDRSRELAGS